MACLPTPYEHLINKCEESSVNDLLRVVFPQAATPKKIAIVSGISVYPNLAEQDQLPAAAADVALMTELYAERLGFDEVIVLENQDVNKEIFGYHEP